ncbi:putative methyltransferase NSUN7 isoform X2 [Numida meleagris]|uniref:putative methyltransferase NSUN7 isoform X2 n=1 Tax=Numida meleagris TaxID=8996 RepID=UPI000B3E0DAD|nr:putative methyltransferase NSUN7 isoform X2 [Numida meleagris]XP_021253072.1 putative methyltransferase NSUN7 isoform X2 [Numida meleagris]XP_021253073.1 putative methyltransferase NSUN7 isoform X2 [Numida meleagris]
MRSGLLQMSYQNAKCGSRTVTCTCMINNRKSVLGSKSNLVSFHEDIRNYTSDLSEVKISDEKGAVEKRKMTLIKKNVCHDSVYINAAKIFQGIHNRKPKDRMLVRYGDDSLSPMLTLKDEYSQRLSYELAFSTLKYQDLLEEILLDSHVYPCHSIPDELTSLLLVMLYDMQDRKFEARAISDEEEPIAEVQKIEHFLCRFKIKLAAALARCRIKYDALSIEYFLPETIRKHEQRASALPLCAWINTFKTSLQEVFRDLKSKGFTEVDSVSDLKGYAYCLDQHCHDVVFFPSSLKDELLNLDLFADCRLLLQDKSRSLAVHSAQALLSTDDDVIMAHLGSHLTVAHMSALRDHSTSTVFVCGVKTSAKADELRDLFSHMGCQNIQLLHEDFTEIEPKDPRLKNAKVILLIPQCSGLGFSNPIDFILTERGDAGLLKDLYQGSVSKDKLCTLAEKQLNELMHAMKFQVQSIVYCTSSVYPEENELVVQKALDSGVKGKKLKPFRLIPPVFPTCSNPESRADSFFKIEPSEISSGCFLAIIARETESSENVSAKDIVSRAAEKGLLGSILGKSKEEKKKRKVTQRGSDTARAGIEPKTAKVAHPEAISERNAVVAVSKAVSKLKKKNVNQPTSHVHLKKPTINPVLDTGLSTVPKHTSVGKVQGKQTVTRKPRAERKKMVAVKLVEIVFPPVISPYVHPQGNQPRMPAHISLLQSRQRNRSLRDRVPPPSVSEVVKPTVLRNSHPGP